MIRDRYELIDFGDGRKLESLAGYWIDRPSPAASGVPQAVPEQWKRAGSRYDPKTGQWHHFQAWPESLEIDCGQFRMPVEPTPFGHIGIFPEQADNWDWLFKRSRELTQHRGRSPQTAQASPPAWGLNLFGYRGASTLAMVSAGLGVAHVDAARPNVQACRRAAELNGWADAPIRYLVDDAAKFVAREVRRQRRYRVIVLDPPAYGHSPRGKAWRLERDLWPLLDQCLALLDDPFSLLVTGHSPQVDQSEVADFLRRHEKLQARWQRPGLNLTAGRSQLRDRQGRRLDAGFYVRLGHV